MSIDNYFNIRRFTILLRNDLLVNKNKLMLMLGALLFIISAFFVLVSSGPKVHDDSLHQVIFIFSYLILGWYMTANLFREFADKPRAIYYLTSPTSQLEKYLSKFILTTVVFTLFYVSFYSLMSYVLDITLFNQNVNGWNHDYIFAFISVYLIGHSVFIVGAISFNKYALIKTLFSLFIIFTIGFIVVFILGSGGYLNAKPAFENYSILVQKGTFVESVIFGEHFVKAIIFGVPILLWFIGFMKLKEKEI